MTFSSKYLSLQGLAAFQLVSVETQGKAVVWTVLDTQRDFTTQLGLAHWGQVATILVVVVMTIRYGCKLDGDQGV